MYVEGAVFGDRGEAAPHLVRELDNPLVSALIESLKAQLAASFIQLLGDAAAQVMETAVEIPNLLLIVDALQSGCSHCTVESTGAVENVGDFLAQYFAGTHWPEQRSNAKRDYGSHDRVKDAKPRHVPRLTQTAKNEDKSGGESGGGEGRMNRSEVSEKTGEEKQNETGSDRPFAEQRDKEGGGDRAAGGSDRTIESGLPRSAEICLCHNQCGEDRPIALVQMPSSVDGVGDGAGESGLDSLLD